MNFSCRALICLINFITGLMSTAGENVVRLQELKGNNVIINTGLTAVQSDSHILWLYGPENADKIIVNSLFFKGEINTIYESDRFRDRLQLDRSTASLTIKNISTEYSGVYKLEIFTENRSVWTFSVKVYAPVLKPVIRNQTENCTQRTGESCSFLCSVENSKDVNLSWYKDKERIFSISSSDSSDSLHLPLNITHPNDYTYTCVAANPVSNQTAQLYMTECNLNTALSKVQCCGPVEFVVRLVLSAVVFMFTVFILFDHFTSRTGSEGRLNRKCHCSQH